MRCGGRRGRGGLISIAGGTERRFEVFVLEMVWGRGSKRGKKEGVRVDGSESGWERGWCTVIQSLNGVVSGGR